MLVLIAVAVGLFFWIRSRRQQRQAVHIGRDDAEENIPLNSHRAPSPNGHPFEDEDASYRRKAKGKGRAVMENNGESIFHVGDSDGEDDVGKA